MTKTDVQPVLDQLVTLAGNLGLSDEQLAGILDEVNAKADAEERTVSFAERMIAVRARIMQAGLKNP